MRILLLIIMLCSISVTYAVSQDEEFDFRKTRWGMTMEQVKASEKTPIVFESKDSIAYSVEVTGWEKKVRVVYNFIDDKLVRAKYYLGGPAPGLVVGAHNENYDKAREQLRYNYGQPMSFSPYRPVLPKGAEILRSVTWRTPSTTVTLVLENYGITQESLYIVYESTKYAGLIKSREMEAKEKELKSDF